MPIPTSYQPPKKTFRDFPVIAPGTYKVNIEDIELLHDQPKYKSTELEDKYKFTLVITSEGEFKGQKLWVTTSVNMNAGYKGNPSWLFSLFTAAYRCILTDEEAESVSVEDINSIVGKEIAVSVVNKQSSDGQKTYSNVKGVFPSEIGATHGYDQVKDQFPSHKNGTPVTAKPNLYDDPEAQVAKSEGDFLTDEMPSVAVEPEDKEITLEDIPF